MEKRSRGVKRNGLTDHHLLFYKTTWESHPHYLELRNNPQFIAEIGPDEHDEVHEVVSYVPALSIDLAARTLGHLKNLKRTTDPVKGAENFQRSVEHALKYGRKFDTTERLVGELAIYAVDLQKPYIQPPSSTTYIDLKYDGVKPEILWVPD